MTKEEFLEEWGAGFAYDSGVEHKAREERLLFAKDVDRLIKSVREGAAKKAETWRPLDGNPCFPWDEIASKIREG